ncbi:MAG: glucose-1-phosphate thymidylyltransferase [Candidatus Thioglobus sp. MED-G23]|nr:MAG: glucose-1-phosphate thymidylyltransferase [Candidatus Thioglobus sp. MED-G23]
MGQKSMNTDVPKRFRSGQAWGRLALMLIYFLAVFEIALLLVGLMMLFQFFYRLIQGQDAERLRSFTQDLNSFIYAALQYVTFNTDEKPFPFCDWPAPGKAEDGPNYY